MGETLEEIEKGLTTFLQALSQKRRTRNTLHDQADNDVYQAALAAAQNSAKNTYLLTSAAEKSRGLYQTQLQTQATQRAQLAASGLRQDSATVQYLLNNSRFQSLLEERQLANELQAAVYENNKETEQYIQALQSSALAKRKAANKGSFGMTVSSLIHNVLGGF